MTAPLLRMEVLNCYFAGLRAVADLSFEVRPGEIKAVIGPNGAGKSTLFNMIAGVTRPTSGQIFFDGIRIDAMPTFRRARLGIARTFQNLQIFRDMTVLENVMTGRHMHGRAGVIGALLHGPSLRAENRAMADVAMELLGRFELDGKADMLAGDLSFGQMKVLELARALASEPRLLLLDEPAAGLSPAERVIVADIIRALPANITIVLIEHDMDLVLSLVDWVTCLNNGQFLAEGAPADIRNNADVQNVYLGRPHHHA
jgi:branched-chain amino acid transport system ATP-binding protein